jgi:sugar lactone lactonase YvrE
MASLLWSVRINPDAGITGGEVLVECSATNADLHARSQVRFDGEPAHLVAGIPRRALVLTPKLKKSGPVEVSITSGATATPIGKAAAFTIGKLLVEDIHPVANPVFDPEDGSLFVTRSGSRGERMSVSVFRITPTGEIEDFTGDVTNPTAMAFDRRGQLYVSSRLDGVVYRITRLKEIVEFAGDLGIATGLAFDEEGNLFVGDRSGTIFRVNEIGEAKPWVELEPSVSAYHLAFGPDRSLYVTGPTVSGFDRVTRIDRQGRTAVFYRGLGRPQGLAFDREGNLYVAASLRGRRGIVRISPNAAEAELVVAGMNLVGLAFSAKGDLVVASNEAVYGLPLGVYGTLV